MGKGLPENLLNLKETPTMPVLFVGHGNPMNAIEDNFYTGEWKRIAKNIPQPEAILCISAHWLTKGSWVTAMDNPPTIHDFYGFPKELFDVNYPAPGSAQFAKYTKAIIEQTEIEFDNNWGLDHGTWSVLKQMYPEAIIPVFQLSIDYNKPGIYHYNLAKELKKLRKKGVLIIGSGNIVHNLQMMKFQDITFDWAREFDELTKEFLLERNDKAIIDYSSHGELAKLAIPTPDHYFPLLYSLGVTDKNEEANFFSEKTTMGAVSMRSVLFQKDNSL